MYWIVTTLHPTTPADREPAAKVVSVHDHRALAERSRAAEQAVLPVAFAPRAGSRKPRTGETLPTMREASGLVAVVQ